MIKFLKNLESGQLFTLKRISCPSDDEIYVFDYYDPYSKKYSCFLFSDPSCVRFFNGYTFVYTYFFF